MTRNDFGRRTNSRCYSSLGLAALALMAWSGFGAGVMPCAAGDPVIPGWMHVPCQTDPGAVGWNEPLGTPRNGFETNAWWGKPMNPSEFWQGKTVWLDARCLMSLKERGRKWPPPAFDDVPTSLRLSNYCAWVADGSPAALTNICNAEHNWWNRWLALLPKPPEDIVRWQSGHADAYMSRKYSRKEPEGGGRTASSKRATAEMADWQTRAAEKALSEGYPLEALDEQALYWAYVCEKRRSYAEECNFKSIPGEKEELRAALLEAFRKRVKVDFDVIVRPLTEEEFKSADEWKRRYIKRLVREETDRTYIDSYCMAWGMNTESLIAEALQDVKSRSPEELVPAYLKERSPARLQEHQRLVVPILARGEVKAARILAARYVLDWDKLTEMAEQAKREAEQLRERRAALSPEEIAAWRKKRLMNILGADEKEAEARAKEWGLDLGEIKKLRDRK